MLKVVIYRIQSQIFFSVVRLFCTVSPNILSTQFQRKMKDMNSSDIRSSRKEKMFDHHSYFGDEYSLEDIRAFFDANDLEMGVTEARAGVVRASNAHIDAKLWMEDYFYRFIFLKLK